MCMIVTIYSCYMIYHVYIYIYTYIHCVYTDIPQWKRFKDMITSPFPATRTHQTGAEATVAGELYG